MELDLKLQPNGKWDIEHKGLETLHNHLASQNIASHSTRRNHIRTPQIIQSIRDAGLVGERAVITATRLRRENPGLPITSRDIYNEQQKARHQNQNGMSKTMCLLSKLSDDTQYFSDYLLDADNHLSALFFAFIPNVEIFKMNHDILVMDCTYRTNRFKMSLLNIVGVSRMNSTLVFFTR